MTLKLSKHNDKTPGPRPSFLLGGIIGQKYRGRRRLYQLGRSSIVLLVILILVFGGGGFYYGPPYHYYGGGLGLILLIVVLVLLFRG